MATDDRLRDALRAAGREPDVDGVLAHVQAKRSRRQTARRAGLATSALAIVGAIVAGGLTIADDGTPEVAVGPAPAVGPRVHVDGQRVDVTAVRIVPDEGYVRAPLIAADGTISFAAYDRAGDGGFTIPPSRVVRIGTDGTLRDRVDLQGEILSLATGEGARWALTRDHEVLGPEDPEFRVKRIDPSGTVSSNPVPPGAQPAGAIVASGGAVWVPVRTGVLQYDPRTGALVAEIGLPEADRRGIAAGAKVAMVTSGSSLLRLDAATSAALPFSTVGEAAIELVDVVETGGTRWSLGRSGDGTRSLLVAETTIGELSLELAEGFDVTTPVGLGMTHPLLVGTGDRVVVSGSEGLHVRVLVVEVRDGALTVADSIRLPGARDEAFALLRDGDALLASAGRLYHVDLPKE